MIFSHSQELKSLTTKSSLAVLLRALYRMGLDYCVLPPSDGFADIIVFTKDQLVSLIERNSSETSIFDISKRVAQGIFKPVAIFKSDASSSNFVSKGGFAEPERLQVLVVDDEGANVSSLKEALIPRAPDFPEWWEAPVPFAMCGRGKVHINRTAMLMFGPDLKRLATSDLPDKNEFLVTLEGRQSPCTVTFRRLEGDIFMLDDCTSDMAAAADIAWWAAVGKAWTATLDEEKRAYCRCDEMETESLRADNMILPCRWEGELLGYFCVAKKTAKKVPRSRAITAISSEPPQNPDETDAKRTKKTKEIEKKRGDALKETRPSSPKDSEENETLQALGPQTMGLLVPGTRFSAEEEDIEEIEGEVSADKPNRQAKKQATTKGSKGKSDARAII
ncbi:MAG: hypothetical protein LBQ42_02660 [Synergistaceae bacterium]|jgi:hypothetical protein|nr:hypothetical protein [Synergistaceae bacterium]